VYGHGQVSRRRTARERCANVGQCAYDAVISPSGVFAGYLHNERFDVRGKAWATGIGTTAGAIEFLYNESAIPSQDSGRFGDTSNLSQILATKPLADLGERGSFGIRKPEPGGELGAENSVLGGEVFTLKEKALIHQPCNVCEQSLPFVVLHDERIG
jgi:hypothetical protein